MAGDPERRFQKVMDRLYHAPKLKPPLPSGKGRRLEPGLRSGVEDRLRMPKASLGSLGPAPPCRPWDRGDLMRRLATFKAMTWFGKPKVVSPVNCARRGWINVEMDTITCEACGARLLFSTPSSWPLQQVEKAAAVFSLKLDSGHRMLCPWIDNSCDETLVLFPPTPPAALVEGFKERSDGLLQLSALPVISLSAMDYMKNPQLEQLLSQPSHLSITLPGGINLTNGSGSKDLDGASDANMAELYYQALKVISICGWEPRLLPYFVDGEDLSSSSAHGANPPSTPNEFEVGKDIHPALGENQNDPTSVVLDCRLCGACVGLWAFATIPRPLEVFTLVASAESNGQSGPSTSISLMSGIETSRAENMSKNAHTSRQGIGNSLTGKENPLRLNLTIAGGPPPTKQNFRPRVSFPIISRHLRAQFGSDTGLKALLSRNTLCMNQVNSQLSSHNDLSQPQVDVNGNPIPSEGSRSSKRKRSDNELGHDVHDQLKSGLPSGCNMPTNAETNEDISGGYAEEIHSLHESRCDVDNEGEVMQMRSEILDQIEPEFAEKEVLPADNVVGDDSNVTERPHTTSNGSDSEATNSILAGSIDVSDPHSAHNLLNCSDRTEENRHDPSQIASSSVICVTLSTADKMESNEGGKSSDAQTLKDSKKNEEMTHEVTTLAMSSHNKEVAADETSDEGNNPEPLQQDNITGFDPIRQHRPFCPWIAPMDGKSMPGWKMTLSALHHQDKDATNSSHTEAPSTFADEVDDPVVSIRKLFMSPPTKRLKGSRLSSG